MTGYTISFNLCWSLESTFSLDGADSFLREAASSFVLGGAVFRDSQPICIALRHSKPSDLKHLSIFVVKIHFKSTFDTLSRPVYWQDARDLLHLLGLVLNRGPSGCS